MNSAGSDSLELNPGSFANTIAINFKNIEGENHKGRLNYHGKHFFIEWKKYDHFKK